jgi:phosphatidylglycerophosphate synthase
VYARGRVQTVIFVPDAGAWRRAGSPGGLSLLERQIRQLRALGLPAPLLLVPQGAGDPALPDELATCPCVRVPDDVGEAPAALAAAADALPAVFLFLAADRLVDARVLRTLAIASGTVFACGDDGAPHPVGRTTIEDVRRHGVALPAAAARLSLGSLDPYVPELRGVATPYLMRVHTPEERRRAWGILLDHVQKRALDLPGEFFDTPFENWLVRRLAPTAVTPNQITVATLILAAGVGMLFLHGWLRLGVVLALVVGVLDGVDGKLARLKFQTSRLGELEHVGDFLYENFWYLAIAAHLRTATGSDGLWWTGVLLVALDLADNLLYQVARARTGRMLDELSSFDRRFRRVAGRRNVYVMMFVVGFFTGHGAGALLAAATWAACTVVVHAVRAFGAAADAGGPVGAQGSDGDPAGAGRAADR